MLEPKEGLLTFRAEGNNMKGSIHYSRVIHWPGNLAGCAKNSSGVTIGRGMDLGLRSKAQAYQTLLRAGILPEQAKKIADGAGLTHCQAAKFVSTNKNHIEEITEIQQLRLFEMVYSENYNNAMDFYYRRKGGGAVAWENLTQEIRDVFVDMFYQGRMSISRVKSFTKNNKDEVKKLINSSAVLLADEKGRNRLAYLTGKK